MKAKTEEEIIKQLVEFAAETRYPNIPKEVVEFAKGIILKTVAGIFVGSTKPSGQKMAMLVKDRRCPEDVGVIGCGFKTSLWEAVFLNAFLAHSAEMTDDFTVTPLVLSLVEKCRLSGTAVLEAVVVGLEVHSRVSMFQNKQMWTFFIPGGVGPAVAAARILGLGVPQMTAALSLATPSVGITEMNMGTDAHFFESAFITLQAILAAEMAKQGMTGNPHMIMFLSNFLGKENVFPEKITKDLGIKWLLCEHWIKKYPSCFLTHRYLDALLEQKKERNISYQDVEAIVADIGSSEEVVNRPAPQTEMDLVFSLQHVLGAALLDGDVNLNHINEGAVSDSRIKEARNKVKVIIHHEWPREDVPGMNHSARITIKMKNGEEFSKERRRARGSSLKDPLTLVEIRGLYGKFTRGKLTEGQIEKTGDTIANLEKLSDTEELMDMLVFGHKV